MTEIVKSDLCVFCYGDNCILKCQCQRYVYGQNIDSHAPGYIWMSSCDIEERIGFISTSN